LTTDLSIKTHVDDFKASFMEGGDEAYIETYTGKRVYFLHPKPDMFDIVDIAHALSNNCRWTGHCKTFFSVAEHSVFASYLVAKPFKLAALMHDASEAYLTDVAAPIKPNLTSYYELEANIMAALSVRFGFQFPLAPEIKVADTILLSEEAYQLLPTEGQSWGMWKTIQGGRPKRQHLQFGFWTPQQAEMKFLNRYQELCHQI
jgi:uncharacterized protein